MKRRQLEPLRSATDLVHYKTALSLAPDNPLVCNNLAFLLADRGELKNSLELAKKASEALPSSDAVKDILV